MEFTAMHLTRYLFLFTVVVLVLFGIGALLRIDTSPEFAFLYVFQAFLLFGDAGIMFFCAHQLEERTKQIFFLSVAVLAINIFPNIFDQFGWIDLLFVSLNMAALAALFMARREFQAA